MDHATSNFIIAKLIDAHEIYAKFNSIQRPKDPTAGIEPHILIAGRRSYHSDSAGFVSWCKNVTGRLLHWNQ
jgi:hypothetical protein